MAFRIGSLVVAALCGCCATLSAADLPGNFSKSYAPAVGKLAQLYTHVTISGTIFREYPQKNRSYEQTYKYRAAGKNLRLDVTTRDLRENFTGVGSKDVYLATPEVSFTAHGGPTDPSIESLKPVPYESVKAQIESVFPFEQPFSLATNGTLLDLLQRPEVNLDELKKVKRNGQSLVKIVFERGGSGGRSGSQEKDWVLLSPSEGWVVREYSKTTGSGADQMTYRGTLGYSRGLDGTPQVERIENWEEKGSNRECVMHEVVSISRFTAGDPPPITFTADGF